ncbi:MAG: hypothetical protein K9M15_01360 [Candidatus Marinimicrobia bacterium]|nr:hypothetical protein [Candidatus Neomarinimicrobiota bacterium]
MGKIVDYIKKEKIIFLICFFVFVASLSYAFYFKIQPAVDSAAYDTIAMSILGGNGYKADGPEVPLEIDGAIAYQGPVYPFFLAGVYGIFGHHYEVVWIIQAFLRALTALFLFLICVKIFGDPSKAMQLDGQEGRKMGWFAASFFGFYPDLIEIGSMLMSETLFIFLTTLFVYIFLFFYKKASCWNTISLAFVFGLIMLVRSSVGLFLPVLLFCFYRKKAWKFLVLFMFIFGVVMTPWAVRNYVVYDKFIPTMANFGFNPWVGNHEGADGEGGNMPELHQAIADLGPVDANEYAAGQFKSFIKAHPFEYVRLTLTRLVKYFSFIRPLGFWFYQHGWSQMVFVASSAMASIVLFIFGFAGIFSVISPAGRGKKEKREELLYLIAFTFLTCLSIIPFLIETRYRLPVYPFMAIFAGIFVYRFIISRKEYLKYLLISAGVLFLNSALNILMEYNKIIDKINQIFS